MPNRHTKSAPSEAHPAPKAFTARSVAGLKPPASGQRDVWDPSFPGFGLRISDRGRKVWVVRYRANGRYRRLTLGVFRHVSLAKARRRAEDALRDAANGKDPAGAKQEARQAAKRAGDTVADLARAFIAKYAKVQKRSWREDQRMIDAEILPAWKSRKVKELTRRDIRELIEGIADRGSPIAANRYLALVRKMLNWAVSKDWIDANPAVLMDKPGAERSRERVLTDDEVRMVWAACEGERPAMCASIRLRLLTAQRGGEISQLRWTDIEGDWLAIPGTITKNKRTHRVFLTPAAKALIDVLPRIEGCDYIFPGASGNRPCSDHKKAGQRIAARVLKELQKNDPTIEHFDFRGHDLRRTASTKMAEAGISQADIARVLNHAEGGPRATQVYNRYQYDREKRIALDTWARTLTAILAEKDEKPGKVVGFQRN